MTRTGIICTLGPVSNKKNIVKSMMDSGMCVARLNFSHSTPKVRSAMIKLVGELNKKRRAKVAILGDLEGYRIRIGRLKAGRAINVAKGAVVWLTKENVLGQGNLIPFDFKGGLDVLKKGHHIFIDDGNIALEVIAHDILRVKTKVVVPGLIKERKGINMPDVKLGFTGLTEKDRECLDFCVKNKVELIAQSFVRSKEDVLLVREYLKGRQYRYRLIAKIENREGIDNIDSIIKVSDGIMVARGDMGVSIPIYEVPMVQKKIIKKCNKAGKFVITATQMLESMTENRMPERAEVSDVANAVLDGTDYVMLSAESAVGAYPVECVEMMERIIEFTESQRIVCPSSRCRSR